MKDSALSIANYFVQKSLDGNRDLKPLKLMKLVYIAHGYMLALFDKSVFNKRFDTVEAWKFGPVVPSVYHSFKSYANTVITEKTGGFVNVEMENGQEVAEYYEPILQDENAKRVCNVVWNIYSKYTDNTLVTLLHAVGTPWSAVYEEGKNNIIPDELTKKYYQKIIKSLIKSDK